MRNYELCIISSSVAVYETLFRCRMFVHQCPFMHLSIYQSDIQNIIHIYVYIIGYQQ